MVYIIDFGMSKEIDENFKKKIKEDKPNFTLMNLVLILENLLLIKYFHFQKKKKTHIYQ